MRITGTPQLKKGRYYAMLRIPTADGTYKQKSIKLNLSEADGIRRARQACKDLIHQLEQENTVYSPDMLFADWVEKWLTHQATMIDSVTMQAYRQYADLRIVPFYRKRRTILQRMNGSDVQDFYDYCLADGLSPNSVRKYRAVVRGALEYALRMEIIATNPASRATIPKDNSPQVGKAYTQEQTNALLDALRYEPIYPAVLLAVTLGLRRGEVCGLKWDAIDFENSLVHIRHTVTGVTETISKGKTKSRTSTRSLSLQPEIASYLKQLRHQQMVEQIAAGEKYIVSDYVCRLSNGTPMRPDYVSVTFRKMLIKHGLPRIRFHDLRHTNATLMLKKNVDLKVVQEMLGHSKLSTTADLYVHVDQEQKEEAAARVTAALSIPS